jgi:hypothetical protein
MFNGEFKQKLFKSPIFLFVYFAVTIGVIHQFLWIIDDRKAFLWRSTLLFSIPTALLLTILTKRKIQKIEKATGHPNFDQARAIKKAFKTGVAPTEPLARKALPKVLDYHYAQLQKSKKWERFPVFFIIGGLGLFMDVLTKPHIPSVTTVLVLAMGLWTRGWIRRQAAKLNQLYQQLGIKPPEPPPVISDYASVPVFRSTDILSETPSIPFEPTKPDPGAGRNVAIATVVIIAILVGPTIFHRNSTRPQNIPSADHSAETMTDTTSEPIDTPPSKPVEEGAPFPTLGPTVQIDASGSAYGDGCATSSVEPGVVPQSDQVSAC